MSEARISDSELQDKLLTAVEDETSEPVGLDTALDNFDSLTFTEVLLAMERQLGIKLDLENAWTLGDGATVATLLQFVKEKLA